MTSKVGPENCLEPTLLWRKNGGFRSKMVKFRSNSGHFTDDYSKAFVMLIIQFSITLSKSKTEFGRKLTYLNKKLALSDWNMAILELFHFKNSSIFARVDSKLVIFHPIFNSKQANLRHFKETFLRQTEWWYLWHSTRLLKSLNGD